MKYNLPQHVEHYEPKMLKTAIFGRFTCHRFEKSDFPLQKTVFPCFLDIKNCRFKTKYLHHDFACKFIKHLFFQSFEVVLFLAVIKL